MVRDLKEWPAPARVLIERVELGIVAGEQDQAAGGGGPAESAAAYRRALALTANDVERSFLRRSLAEVTATGLRTADGREHPVDCIIWATGFKATEFVAPMRVRGAAGETLTDAVLEEIRGHDVILLGAIGDPGVPSGVLERGLLLRLRFELDHYVNLRPARLYPGVTSPLANPGEVDFVVVREGTESLYAGAAACCAAAPRRRSLPRSRSTPGSAWSGSPATRSSRRLAG